MEKKLGMNYKIGFLALISSFVMGFGYITKTDFRPPGTVEIVDNFFYDVKEICNGDWREYLSYLEVNEGIESEIYKNAKADTLVWFDEGGYMDPFVQQYLNHPSYASYPVVGVSQKQAIDYCEWRTKAVKIMLEANEFEGPIDFHYRLPSKTEWELMANAGYDEKGNKIIRKRLAYLQKNVHPKSRVAVVNMKFKPIEGIKGDSIELDNIPLSPSPGDSYLPNKYGVYNINGNVAEMVKEPGIAMGGSFEHFYEDIVPSNKELKYESPQKWLGFRCVCEVTQK